MTITATTAADLNRNHLGMTIRVRQGSAEFTDVLHGISHEADIIEERKISQEVPDYMLGRIATTLSLLQAGDVQVNGTTEIDIVVGY